jgi:hypothetical protein
MSMTRDVMITIADLTFTVAVTPDENNHGVRRWNTRMAGNKQAIDEVLDAGVLSEIDARIKAGEFDEIPEAPAPFDEQAFYDSYMADFHPNQNIVKVTK